MEVIISERGKELSNIKYSFVIKRKDGLIKWVCTDKNCSASILTTADKSSLH